MSTSRVFLTSGINKDVGAAQAELWQKYYMISCHSSPEANLWSGKEATKGQPRGLSLESFNEKIMNQKGQKSESIHFNLIGFE